MDGILPLWKERGMTSHDCVFKLRKILHTKKIGHGGTLDPDVEGVLPICVGKGTKVIEYMVDSGKTYEGEITLGFATTTEDVSGESTSEPIFNESAQTQSWRFKVVCGKGTYVRTLSVDTGKKLGYPAHMSDLTRTASGGLQAAQCLTLEEVAKQMAAETIDQCLLPIETAVEQFPRIDLSDELYQKVKNGMRLHKKELGIKAMPESLVALFYQNQVVSLYMPHPTHDKLLKPSKVLRNN